MEDMLKKILYTGVGIATITAEKLQETVDEWVGKGQVSEDEGKKIVDDFWSKVDNRRHEVEDKLKDFAESVTNKVNLPRVATDEDIESLVKRIEALEAKAGIKTAEKVQDAVAKTAAEVKEVAEEAIEAAEEATEAVKKTTKKKSSSK
jgi:polyhydroxyalkanoate synthesis regulator phasin